MVKTPAEKQRDYRARQKKISDGPAQTEFRVLGGGPPTGAERVAKEALAEVKLEDRLKRNRTPGSKLDNPFTDGLPDYPELISAMPQKAIDQILDRINKPK